MNLIRGFSLQEYGRLLAAMFTLVACLLLVGCGQRKAAIESVMHQYTVATVEFTNSFTTLSKNPIQSSLSGSPSEALQQYEDKLRAIDISDCPDDFRAAFVQYYQSVDGFKTYSESITGWRGVLKGALNPTAIFTIPNDTDKAMQPVQEAGKSLVLVCTKYGLKFQ